MSDGGYETSPLAVSLFVVAFLMFVCVVTAVALYREEAAFRAERKSRQRMRSEANRYENRREIESDYE